MKTKKCPICDKIPNWPTVDYSTGFTFCDDCFVETRYILDDFIRVCNREQVHFDLFTLWLKAIAEQRSRSFYDEKSLRTI